MSFDMFLPPCYICRIMYDQAFHSAAGASKAEDTDIAINTQRKGGVS